MTPANDGSFIRAGQPALVTEAEVWEKAKRPAITEKTCLQVFNTSFLRWNALRKDLRVQLRKESIFDAVDEDGKSLVPARKFWGWELPVKKSAIDRLNETSEWLEQELKKQFYPKGPATSAWSSTPVEKDGDDVVYPNKASLNRFLYQIIVFEVQMMQKHECLRNASTEHRLKSEVPFYGPRIEPIMSPKKARKLRRVKLLDSMIKIVDANLPTNEAAKVEVRDLLGLYKETEAFPNDVTHDDIEVGKLWEKVNSVFGKGGGTLVLELELREITVNEGRGWADAVLEMKNILAKGGVTELTLLWKLNEDDV